MSDEVTYTKILKQALKKAGKTLPDEGKVRVLGTVSSGPFTVKTPHIAVANILLANEGISFKLPKNSFKVITAEKQGSQFIKIFNRDSTSSSLHLQGSDFILKDHSKMTSSKVDGKNVITNWTQITISPDNLSNISWQAYDYTDKPIKLSFALTSKADSTITANMPRTTMTIDFNKPPYIDNRTVLRSFGDITAKDSEGDFVQAFEVRLVNENLFGKYGTATLESPRRSWSLSNVYAPSIKEKGVRFGQADLNVMRLYKYKENTPLDQEGLASSYVRIKVRACDEHFWGDFTTLHVPWHGSLRKK